MRKSSVKFNVNRSASCHRDQSPKSEVSVTPPLPSPSKPDLPIPQSGEGLSLFWRLPSDPPLLEHCYFHQTIIIPLSHFCIPVLHEFLPPSGMGVSVSLYNLSKDKFIVKLWGSWIPMLTPSSKSILIYPLWARKLVIYSYHRYEYMTTGFQREWKCCPRHSPIWISPLIRLHSSGPWRKNRD